MMMRPIASYLITALSCIAFVSANPAFGAVAENNDLTEVISQYQDAHMTVEDLAFFLATHNYNATPKDDYVQITINGSIYKAVPNRAIGLAEISFIK